MFSSQTLFSNPLPCLGCAFMVCSSLVWLGCSLVPVQNCSLKFKINFCSLKFHLILKQWCLHNLHFMKTGIFHQTFPSYSTPADISWRTLFSLNEKQCFDECLWFQVISFHSAYLFECKTISNHKRNLYCRVPSKQALDPFLS